MLDMYQSYVLHGGPLDGYAFRARPGTVMVHAVNPDGSAKGADTLVAYKRVTILDNGPFGRNEYHWVDPATIVLDDD